MIFLQTPNMFQLRLGWLVRAAHLLANGSLNRNALGEALLKEATALQGAEEAQDEWLRSSGLVRKPHGKISPRATDDIVRMCVTYGVYAPDAQTLTDLGHVLLAADRMEGTPPVFTWRGAKKFAGLRLVMEADGDVTLALLRGWPDGKVNHPLGAAPVVSACLRQLAEAARREDERQALLAQSQKERLRDLVSPRLEPLRELGYFDSGEAAGEYRLTEAGNRLRIALREAPDATLLLRFGLPKAFLRGEGLEPEGEASPELLLETLKELPPGLRGAAQEAPLEAVALLAQCRLLAKRSRQWMDLRSVEQAVASLSQRLRGRIGIKAGTSTRAQNITWADEQALAGSAGNGGDRGQSSEAVALSGPKSPAQPEGTTTSAAGASPPSLPVELTPVPSAPLLLWLSFVARLLDPPSLGGVSGVQNGGPWTWCDALLRGLERPPEVIQSGRQAHKLFPGKKEPEWVTRLGWGSGPLPTLPLRRGLQQLKDKIQDLAPIHRALDVWEQRASSSRDEERPVVVEDIAALRVALLRARDAARQQFPSQAAGLIRSFLKQPSLAQDWSDWEPVAEATRALVEDAISRGLGSRAELAGRMRQLLSKARSDVARAAEDILSALSRRGQRSRFEFNQELIVPERIAHALERAGTSQEPYVHVEENGEVAEVFFSVPQGKSKEASRGGRWLNASGQVMAPDAERARHRAVELMRDGLARVTFEAARIIPRVEEHESPRFELWELRLADKEGKPIIPDDPSTGEPVWLLRPAEMGFEWKATHDSLRKELASLPTLEKLERTGTVDARARVARAIHWLGIAEQMDARPPDRLARAWIAVEHLVAEGLQTKGPVVIRHLVDAAVVEQMLAAVGETMREVLAALHLNACVKPDEPGLVERLVEVLGADETARYKGRTSGLLCTRKMLSPSADSARLSDAEALTLFSGWYPRVADISSLIGQQSPYAAWRLRKLQGYFENPQKLNEWVQGLRLEAAALLQHVYDLRNQFVHDADPFVFEESNRLQDLYIRFRGLIDPLLTDLLQRLTREPEGAASLSMAWAEMEARYAELLHLLESSGDTKKQKRPYSLASVVGHLNASA